jgi:hypothetical protein
MNDLIWIGNTLLPRGVVFGASITVLLAIAGVYSIWRRS